VASHADGGTPSTERLASLREQLGLAAAPESARTPRRRPWNATLRTLFGDIARRLNFEVRIPGQHGNGVSNQDILRFRVAERRDFTANTPTLRTRVKDKLIGRFITRTNVPSAKDIRDAESEAILETVALRIDGALRDVPIKTLTIPYWKWKKKHGGAGKPVGVLTGRWERAVKSRAKVVFVGETIDSAIGQAIQSLGLGDGERREDDARHAYVANELRLRFGSRVNPPTQGALRNAARASLRRLRMARG